MYVTQIILRHAVPLIFYKNVSTAESTPCRLFTEKLILSSKNFNDGHLASP